MIKAKGIQTSEFLQQYWSVGFIGGIKAEELKIYQLLSCKFYHHDAYNFPVQKLSELEFSHEDNHNGEVLEAISNFNGKIEEINTFFTIYKESMSRYAQLGDNILPDADFNDWVHLVKNGKIAVKTIETIEQERSTAEGELYLIYIEIQEKWEAAYRQIHEYVLRNPLR